MDTQVFTLPTSAFDVTLVPPEARIPGSASFREGIRSFFEKAFAGFGGQVNIVVQNDQVFVTWNTDPETEKPLNLIIEKLQRGERAESIQLLKLLLARNPDDMEVLYNLALALSDNGQAELAEFHMRRVVEIAPTFVNGLGALGTILTRQKKNVEARAFLEMAVQLDPTNGWILRNLGVVLMKEGKHKEAAGRFREAVTLNLKDQGSWLGFADALKLAGETEKAEEAYRHAIALSPHNNLAEAAREGLAQLAVTGFKEKAIGGLRPDAVEYCASAIRRFAGMVEDDLKHVAMEIAALGRSGLDVNSPERRYQLKTLPGDFSGLQLVCYLYSAIQEFAPGTDVGFDLSKEYAAAKEGEGNGRG